MGTGDVKTGQTLDHYHRPTCATAAIPWYWSIFGTVDADMAFPLRMGNTSPLEPPPSGRAASRMSSARRHTGTRCSRFAFIRAAPLGSGVIAGPRQLAVGERQLAGFGE